VSRVLIGVGASAACFKAVAVCSALTKAGHEVQAVLTRHAAKLVTPLQFSAVTGVKALCDEWEPANPSGMDHISFARAADLLLVCPASAGLLGSLAHGLAGDLLGSLALAFGAGKPRLLVPAMNPTMWEHPAVRRNVETLRGDGWSLVGPEDGATACGESGPGRMSEPETVCAAVRAALAR